MSTLTLPAPVLVEAPDVAWLLAQFPGVRDVRERAVHGGGARVTGRFHGALLACTVGAGSRVARVTGVCSCCGALFDHPGARVWTRLSTSTVTSVPAPALTGAGDFARTYGERFREFDKYGDARDGVALADRRCPAC